MAGVFGLKKVYNRQRVDNWSESANYGYFSGNYPSFSGASLFERIDFSSETVTVPGPVLAQARHWLEAVSNSNYGYFVGGEAPPQVCTIDRIDFSSETVSLPGPSLSQNKSRFAALSNPNYGYFAGGVTPALTPTLTCAIDRIDFSSETVVAPGTYQLNQRRYDVKGVSTSNYGYFAGGALPGASCAIDRIDFSSETIGIPALSLIQPRQSTATVSNSDYGYIAGGIAPPYVCTIDRIDFSNETISQPGPSLTEARAYLASAFNSNYGYFAGGLELPGTPPYSKCTIDRLDFSSETVSLPGNNLTTRRERSAGVSGG